MGESERGRSRGKKSVGKRSTEKGEAGGGIRKKGNEGRKKGDEIMEKERGRKR